jgi:outer membrane protein TolC
MGLEPVILGTLRYSPQVKKLGTEVPIREDAIVEAQGDFDPKAFVESKFLDTSDPVGSDLTTGGPNRYIDQNWNYSNGLRKKALTGAQVEVSQKIGYEDSNSYYFNPKLQGSARLSLNITQPLLNGAGVQYNSRLIVLAQINAASSRSQVAAELQKELLDVYQAYWRLHLQRAMFIQRRRLYKEGLKICCDLEGRKHLDAMSQLERAKAFVASWYGAMIQHQADLLNADARLRTLINDPNLLLNRCQELITIQPPLREPCRICVQDSLVTALQYRPEINAIREELKAACVRQDVAKNELRPVLNLILTSYVSGLQGDVNIGRAMGDQFTLGRPTYSTGMVFEYPLGNRTARAKMHKQVLEYSKWTYQLAKTTSEVRLEVETAIRDIDTAYRETVCQAHAVNANRKEIEYLRARWELSLDEQRSASYFLEDMLNAYDRLGRSETAYATYLVDYNVGFAKLNKATGTLLECQPFRLGMQATPDDRMPPAPSTSPAPPLPPPYNPPTPQPENYPPLPPDLEASNTKPTAQSAKSSAKADKTTLTIKR